MTVLNTSQVSLDWFYIAKCEKCHAIVKLEQSKRSDLDIQRMAICPTPYCGTRIQFNPSYSSNIVIPTTT